MPGESIGDAYVDIHARADNFEAEAQSQLGGAVKKVMGAVAGVAAAYKVFDFGKDAFAAAEESEKVAKQTEAVIKSTGGAAQVSAAQISDLANSISRKVGIDDEAIQSGENLLLTFTNVQNKAGEGNDIFNQATKLMVDMGKAMGGDASSSAIQLGKALNDPEKGITALTRVGVTFTDQQKEQIKAMQEAGDMAGAQKVILAELSKEFGGSAEAQATAADKAKVAWGNFQEMLGGVLMPVVSRVMTAITELVTDVMNAFDEFGGGIDGWSAAIGAVVADVLGWFGVSQAKAEEWGNRISDAFRGVVEFIQANWPTFQAVVEAVFNAVSVAVEFIATEVMPRVITAVSAVVDWVQANWPTIREVVTTVINDVQAVIETVLGAIQAFWNTWGDEIIRVVVTAFNLIRETIQNVMEVIQGIIDVVMGVIQGDWGRAWDGIKEILGGVLTEIKNLIGAAFNFISTAIDVAMTLIAGIMDAAWDKIKELTKAALGKLLDIIEGLFTSLPGKVGGLAVSAGAALIRSLEQGLNEIVAALAGVTVKVWSWLGDLASSAASMALGVGARIVDSIVSGIESLWGSLADVGGQIFDAIVSGVGDIGSVIKNKILGGLSGIGNTIKGAVGLATGGNVTPDFDVPHYAVGGNHTLPGGLAVVGENGPELVQFGGNAAVFPTAQLARAIAELGSGGGGVVIQVTVSSELANPRQTGMDVGLGAHYALAQRGWRVSAAA